MDASHDAGSVQSESFSKLKRDLLFHEKRLSLLLGTNMIDDVQGLVREQTLVRQECDTDCRRSLERLERDAVEARMSGHWDEGKVVSLFQLEVPQRSVVGSSKFEAPPAAETHSLDELARRTQRASEKHAAFANPEGSEQALQRFLTFSKGAGFSAADVRRLREAVSAKLLLIEELDDLMNVIQSSSVAAANERAELEALKLAEERSRAAGEIALSEDAINKRMEILQKIVDIQLFQVQTVDATVEANVKRQRSNLAQFQSAAAMLECFQEEKKALVEGCRRDFARLERGMLYETEATNNSRGGTFRTIQDSADNIKVLEGQQSALLLRLNDLARLFDETESELRKVGQQRYQAVQQHAQLVENSRHVTLDYMELKKLAEAYSKKLQATLHHHQEGVDAIGALRDLLLQGREFASFDFNASARRLADLQRRLCVELNEACNEFEHHGREIIRRKSTYGEKIKEELDMAYCEAETRKETFDPTAKRYITRQKDLSVQLEKLRDDMQKMKSRIDEQRASCLVKIREHLPETEISSLTEAIELRELKAKENLLDLRQELLESGGGPGGDLIQRQTMDILEQRTALAREIPVKYADQVKSTTPEVAIGSRGNSAGTSSNSSVVRNIRADIMRSKAIFAPRPQSTQSSESAATQPDVAAPTVDVKVDQLDLNRAKKPRVIGASM